MAYIDLHSPVVLSEPGIILDGSDASWKVCTKGYSVVVDCDGFTIRHMRFRPGAFEYGDCLSLNPGSKNGLLEYCSLSWGVDSLLDVYTENLEIRYCIFSEPLQATPLHASQGYGIGVAGGAKNIDIHHCLIAHSFNRNPKIGGTQNSKFRFANNVVYNCYYNLHAEPVGSVNPYYLDLMGNYFKNGPESYPMSAVGFANISRPDLQLVYLQGNIGPYRPTDDLPEIDIVSPSDQAEITLLESPSMGTPEWLTDAQTAYADVLAHAGATLPERDAIDARIVADVQNGTGGFINDPSEVGGWVD